MVFVFRYHRSLQYVSIGLLLAHLLYSTPTCFLLLWESILRIKLHLQSTINSDGLLVQFALMRSDESALRSCSNSALDCLRGLLDNSSTLSSVNVGQTL